MNNIEQIFTPEQIEERARENSRMYWNAREREEREERDVNRPHISR